VPVVNIKGVQAGQLYSTGPPWRTYISGTSAVERRAMRKLNPKLALPDTTMPRCTARWLRDQLPVLRLPVEVEPEGSQTVGANTSVQWPVGIGAKGNEGVANMTHQTDAPSAMSICLRQADQHGLLAPSSTRRQDGRSQPRIIQAAAGAPTGPMHRAIT